MYHPFRHTLFFLIAVSIAWWACGNGRDETPPLKNGMWEAGVLVEKGHWLPFSFELQTGDALVITLVNGQERIRVDEVRLKDDSVSFRLPLYDSEIRAKWMNEGETMEGQWFNYSRGEDYILPFRASLQKPETAGEPVAKNYAGRWKTIFNRGTDDAYDAVGEFQLTGNRIHGTFLTETGDYRYLTGKATDEGFFLSRFDGAHAFLFECHAQGDGRLEGIFWSGIHSKETLWAERNDDFRLRAADSLTFLKEGYDRFSFSFPGLDGKEVSLDDPVFAGKVVVVQLMGTWCPNCIDETRFLMDMYGKYHEKGLEVVALCFERTHDFEKAKSNIERIQKRLGDPGYRFLIAGYADKNAAAEALPMINHVMAFPTALYIGRDGKVKRIHTGFSGPGTGSYYEDFRKETIAFLEGLLQH